MNHDNADTQGYQVSHRSSPTDDPYDHRFEFESPPPYNSDSENESIERERERIACEVAEFLLEQNKNTGKPSTPEVTLNLPPPVQPTQRPSILSQIRRKSRKPLRRPKPETIAKLNAPVYRQPKIEQENIPDPPSHYQKPEHSLASGYWLPPQSTPTASKSSDLDPSWGNHDKGSKPNTWESIYDTFYSHPKPDNGPTSYRERAIRNSIDTSTEDSSVFSENYQHTGFTSATPTLPTPILVRNEYPFRPSQQNIPHYCPANTHEQWRPLQHIDQQRPPADLPRAHHRIIYRPRRPLSDQSNVQHSRPFSWPQTRSGNGLYRNIGIDHQVIPPVDYRSEYSANPLNNTTQPWQHQSPAQLFEARINSVGHQVEELRRDFDTFQNRSPPRNHSRHGHQPDNGW